MGIIPQAQQNVRMNPNNPVPIAGTGDARIAGEAIASVGQGIEQIGKALNDHYQRQEELQKINIREEAKNKIDAGYARAYDEAGRESAPDGSDFGLKFNDKVMEYVNPHVQDVANTGYKDVYDLVNQYSKNAGIAANSKVAIDSANMLEKDNYRNLESSIDQDASTVEQNPSEAMFGAKLRNFNAKIDEITSKKIMSAENADKLRAVNNEKLVQGLVNGYTLKGQYSKALNVLRANQEDPNLTVDLDPVSAKALGVIDSRQAQSLADKGEHYKIPLLTKGSKVIMTPEISEAMKSVDANKKSQMIEQLQNKAKAESTVRLGDLNSELSGFKDLAIGGGNYDDTQVARMKNKINMAPNIPVESKLRLNDEVNAYNVANKQLRLLADLPRSSKNDIINGFDQKMAMAEAEAAKADPRMGQLSNDFVVKSNRMEVKEKLAKAVDRIFDEQEKDPAGFIIGTDKVVSNYWQATKSGLPQDMQNYDRAVLEKQKVLGIKSMKLLPDAKDQADRLKAMPNGYEADKFIEDLQNKHGEYFPMVMEQIASQDKDLDAYRAIGYIPSGVRAGVINTIKNQAKINESFNGSSAAAFNKSIVSTVSDGMEGFRKGLLNGVGSDRRLEIANAVEKAVQLDVKSQAMRSGGLDVPTSMIKDSVNKILNNNFYSASGGRSQVIVPTAMVEGDLVDNFLARNSTAEGLAQFAIQPPKSYQGDFVKDLEKTGVWVTNDAMDGVVLRRYDAETGEHVTVRNKYNKDIEILYKDIKNNPELQKAPRTFNDSRFMKEVRRQFSYGFGSGE